jgi:predicted nucleic acid-binding protein
MVAAMSRGVLDTSVLVSDDVTHLPGELAVSVVSLAELHFGVLAAASPEARARRLAKLSQLQRRFDPLPSTRRWRTATACSLPGSPRSGGRRQDDRWTC